MRGATEIGPNPSARLAFDLFSRPQRVDALRVLRTRQPPVALETLADHVDRDGPRDDAAGGGQGAERRTTTRLHHTHLPKLEEAGLITYDARTQTVTGIDEDRLDALLEAGSRVLASLQHQDPTR
jgi:hypothetical protein